MVAASDASDAKVVVVVQMPELTPTPPTSAPPSPSPRAPTPTLDLMFGAEVVKTYKHDVAMDTIETLTFRDVAASLSNMFDKSVFETSCVTDVLAIEGAWVLKCVLPLSLDAKHAMALYRELVNSFGPVRMSGIHVVHPHFMIASRAEELMQLK